MTLKIHIFLKLYRFKGFSTKLEILREKIFDLKQPVRTFNISTYYTTT